MPPTTPRTLAELSTAVASCSAGKKSTTTAKVDEIYETVLDIFRTAAAEGIPTYKAAGRIAERRLNENN